GIRVARTAFGTGVGRTSSRRDLVRRKYSGRGPRRGGSGAGGGIHRRGSRGRRPSRCRVGLPRAAGTANRDRRVDAGCADYSLSVDLTIVAFAVSSSNRAVLAF